MFFAPHCKKAEKERRFASSLLFNPQSAGVGKK